MILTPLGDAARARGIDLAAVVGSAPPNTALMRMMAAMARTHQGMRGLPGRLLVPARHLSGLGIPEMAVRHLISATAPAVEIVDLRPPPLRMPASRTLDIELHRVRPATEHSDCLVNISVLDEDVMAAGVKFRFERGGLALLVPRVLELLRAAITPPPRHTPRTTSADAARLQILCPAGAALTILLWDPHAPHAEIPATLQHTADGLAGVTVERARSEIGGIGTRIVVPLDSGETLETTMESTTPRKE
ncbi:hypothetical protein D5S18_25050 [Nocardia panacis]|uniref:Uncharacterized protein n=1 Tax=Nocardia panacis TaxID=2340916 RepID=A0A3A4KCR3_9NOCA|nr:hypothetical protein [Nocardia panacis]RJO71439.1 hypothetical protein D5S18_25050 [Nocardia panacis]